MAAVLFGIIGLFACSAKEIRPDAKMVRIVTSDPPGTCKYLGDVTGDQGGLFGEFTSNKNLEIGARNDLKNKAADLGANIVQLITNRAESTGSWDKLGGSQQQTNVIYSGSAYFCRNQFAKRASQKIEVTDEELLNEEDKTLTIVKISKGKFVYLKGTDLTGLIKGESISFNKSCELKVLKKSQTILKTYITKCNNKKQIQKGMKITI